MSNKALIFIACSVLLSMLVFTGYQYVFEDNIFVGKDKNYQERICIPEGMKFEELLKHLHENDIVHEPLSFAFLAKLMKYRENIKPGCYLLKSGMSNVEAIRLLRSGEQVQERLTFSNARFIEDLAGDLAGSTTADSAKMAAMLKDPKVAEKYGFTSETFIAMFIPNTYYVYWSDDETKILDRMKKEFDNFWTKEKIDKAKSINMTPIQVITIASIVDEETNQSDEMARIAGVFVNRLNDSEYGKLEADPTVKFALKNFEIKRVSLNDLQVDSPYNTYKHRGLPPGPICMPGLDAVNAVLDYEKHQYYFYCADKDKAGYHKFSKSYSDHLDVRDEYTSSLDKRDIKR